MDKKLRVGYSRIVTNPDEPVPLGGYGNCLQRYHNQIMEDICVSCVAITDPEETSIMMVSVDFVHTYNELADDLRNAISNASGIPTDKIYISATHTHAGAALFRVDQPEIRRYLDKIYALSAIAAAEAMADRKPAVMEVGSIETHNLNFIKHYNARCNNTGEMSIIGDCFGNPVGKTLVSHATVVDPTLHVLRFRREGEKPVVLANFRAHPHFRGGHLKYILSSDYIGSFRTALEAMADCHGIFFQGACGNINASTRMPDERRYSTCVSYGTALAATTLECLEKFMMPAKGVHIRTSQQTVQGNINRVPEELFQSAQKIHDLWEQTHDYPLCVETGEPLGIRSPYHANAMIRNMKLEDKDVRMTVNAVSIGDEIAFVTFPGELFDALGVRMEENSPYKTTMLLGYSHHHVSYLPSMVAYKYTSYETDITRFAPGEGEKLADVYVQMLNQLKNS